MNLHSGSDGAQCNDDDDDDDDNGDVYRQVAGGASGAVVLGGVEPGAVAARPPRAVRGG